jgi:hypothetical protein
MKVTLLQSVWGEKCCGTEHNSVPACLPPSLTVFCVSFGPHNNPSSCPYNSITAGLRNAEERVSYEVRTDLRQTSVSEVVPWITSFLAGLSRRRPEFDPGRSSAGTGFAPSVIPPMPHTHLHLTTTPIRSRSRRDLGNFEIQGAQSTTVLSPFSSFELLKPVIY